jgi:hypothetical protein
METVIIAPHPDDEIIGCYEKLLSSNPIIIYDGDTDEKRREEILELRKHVDIKLQMFQKSLPTSFINKDTILYFPDPIYELHPLHRQWGSTGESLARSGYNVIFYTTNMNAPYIHEVENPKAKETLLNTAYPLQNDLWKYEKKYVLFEGYCKWIF